MISGRCKYVLIAVIATVIFSADGYAQQVFTEVAASLGVTGQTGLGHSVGWCDIDNDGDLDIAMSNQDGSGFWLYRNNGTDFTNITSSAGLGGLGARRILWGEVTGDEYSDLVLDWGSSQKLFGNNGDATFTDLTSGSGLTGDPVCIADFDNDGSADVLTLTSSGCSVLLNSGGGVFTAQVAGTGDWWVAVTLDYDLDGDQDIYLGTYGNDPNALLRNDGSSFTDVTASAGVAFSTGTGGVTAGDYNNDGYIDLYLGNYSAPCCKLFENNGDGTFSDVTIAAGVAGYNDTRTSGFTDYNNDGWLDIFSSHHDFYTYSNIMWRNNGNGTFSNVGVSLGLSGEMIGDYFGTAWGDYNLDGDVDLFAVGHIDKYVLFRNDQSATMPANYVTLELEGTVSNRNAIGARVVADLGSLSLTRCVRGGEGYHDFHSLPIEFGLYDAASIQSLQINWPSGLVETYTDISANQFIYAIEGDTLITGITGDSPQAASGDLWLNCSPNPCADHISLNYSGENGVTTSLAVFDLSGRLVRSLGSSVLDGSLQNAVWNGFDDSGNRVPGGVYICRLLAPHEVVTRKVTLLR
ncbi:MAG: FG-GAP-like repeat-containing protein [Candidatus Fermentibacteria bacterium]